MCNVAEPDEQDTKLSWQPSWTKHLGFQMPNLIKVVTCQSSPDQGAEKEVINSNMIEQEVLDSVADLVYSEMDSQQIGSLATGDSFDQQEVVVLLFVELPSFVDQEKEEEIPVTSVQQGVHDQESDQSLENDFDNIIADFCEKLEMSEFVPIQKCSIMEEILSNDYVQEGKLETSALDSHEISSFDEFLADLTEDDDVLTMEEELTWQLMMQDSYKEPEGSKKSSSIKPEFNISRGCPIRHLSRMGPVPKIPIIEQQIQHVYSPQICINIDQIEEVKFVALLVIVPWAVSFIFHDYVMVPFLNRYVELVPFAAQLLDVRKDQKMHMVDVLKQEKLRLHFEAEIHMAPLPSEEELWEHMRHKARELREDLRLENRKSFANIWSDMVAAITAYFILVFNQSKVELLRFTGSRILKGISGAGKAFILIMAADIFLGYHSESGWHTLIEMLLEHYGLTADESAITVFISTVPIAVDVRFKLWVFKYLPRLSPPTSATFNDMKRH